MEFTENFKAALDGIAGNKMRALLSILGIIIGIVVFYVKETNNDT